jgi:hypothetical protein
MSVSKPGPHFTIRPPSTLPPPSTPTGSTDPFLPPPVHWLSGTWHVTHSTLPIWRTKRNVRITYTALPPSDPSLAADKSTDRLDDLVEYQPLSSSKVKTVRGIDKAAGLGSWDWRGKGWLVIAGSHWEVLGWGMGPRDSTGFGEQWVVTYFAKTLFTPAGLDVYSRSPEGLSQECLEGIKGALAGVGDVGFKGLVGSLFEIRHEYDDEMIHRSVDG